MFSETLGKKETLTSGCYIIVHNGLSSHQGSSRSSSSENNVLFKPLSEHGSLFSVADPKCQGKKCRFVLTALHYWVVVFIINFMKALKFFPIESIDFRRISSIDCDRNFYWCSMLNKMPVCIFVHVVIFFCFLSIYNLFVCPFYEPFSPPQCWEKYSLESARFIFQPPAGIHFTLFGQIIIKHNERNRCLTKNGMQTAKIHTIT